ncbi:MAG: T9SS type A sorting domain-containing protein [Chlorobi bacterium]|nr:T9SS type A sorting domain-containing protein [Chlorobiota bacterium]
MKNLFKLAIITILYISLQCQSILFAGRIEVKFFSSETGYVFTPDHLFITDAFNTKNYISFHENSNHSYTAELNSGSYFITAVKSGYISSQTEFTISDNEIRYDIFLDPLVSSAMLNPQRIKSLLRPDKALLLGCVVDDITGIPLRGVELKDASMKTLAVTDANGYFDVILPALCDERNLVNLYFEKTPYNRVEYTGFEITPNTDFIFTLRMKKGTEAYSIYSALSEKCEDCTTPTVLTDMAVSGFVMPLNIRVGRNCTGTNCTYAQVYTLQTYCKYVLPAEVYACWGNLSGGMNSLQACAVAVRSYGMYYVYNPINPALYDICDNTYCQYMGSVLSTNTSNAVDNTFPYILTNSSGVVRSEYSAENNNKGCGNGYSGTGSSWPCIYDPVCTNATPNGHGRGLCQWGTVRWATGSLVTTSSPCSMGNLHSYGTKTWQQILTHYYSVSPVNWSVTLGTTAVINTSSAVPPASNPCSQVTINNNVTTNGTASLMIGASIALTGTGNWISDPANDIKRTFTQGTANYTRNFVIPCSAAPGTYDLYTALWYDKNNNNLIDGGDFVVSSKITSAAITISPIGINPISGEIPLKYDLKPNYPNPFNPVTKIRFSLPKQTNVEVIIYDLFGREVAALVNEQLKPGVYELDWDASNFASGVYFYSLITSEYVDTKKMVLIK